jgi:hypothetical protein
LVVSALFATTFCGWSRPMKMCNPLVFADHSEGGSHADFAIEVRRETKLRKMSGAVVPIFHIINSSRHSVVQLPIVRPKQ